MKSGLYVSIAILSLALFSCAKDSATDPNSPSNPTTDSRESFTGSWNVTENSTTSNTPNTYIVSIGKQATNSSAIVINNFYGLTNYSVSATVSGNSFIIPYQSIKNNTNSTIGFASGSGVLTTATKIDITYTTSISGNRDSCSANYTK